jgi:hypothetical protein
VSETLEVAAAALGHGPVRTPGWVGGTIDGQPIVYIEREGTSIVHARLPAPVRALVLDIFPETELTRRRAEEDLQVDVAVGDRAFDLAFVVEAAPTDIAAALLEDPLRAWMRERRVTRFRVIDDDGVAVVEVVMPRLAVSEVATALAKVAGFAAGLARRVQWLGERLELEAARGGAAYRSDPDGALVAAIRRRREAELAALQRSNAVPDGSGSLLAVGVVVGIIGFLLSLL